MNNYYIVAEATKTRLCCSKIEVIAANFYDHHHELRNINLSNDNGYFLFYINFSFILIFLFSITNKTFIKLDYE